MEQNETYEFQIVPQDGTNAGGTGCVVTNWNSIHAIRLALLDVAERR